MARKICILAAAAAIVLTAAPVRAQSALGEIEAKCAAKLGKSAGKLASTVLGETAKCHDDDISLKETVPMCPDADAQDKIANAAAKLAKTVAKECGSTCSDSAEVTCLADSLCPPSGAGAEVCDGGPEEPGFDMANLGFPGPYCEALLGGPISDAADLSDCVDMLATDSAEDLIDVIYGELDNMSAVSEDGAKCLSSLSKTVRKQVLKIYKTGSKCRDNIYQGKTTGLTDRCPADDEKELKAIAKAAEKVEKTITKKCSDALIGELDLCGNGPGGTAGESGAIECLTEAALEYGDTFERATTRTFAEVSLAEAAFPPPFAVCGDGIVNQLPNAFALIGEECDLGDDSACPGQCLPPGDVFECTCAGTPRMMTVSDGITADLDTGWTGFVHDQFVADGSNFIVEYDSGSCDCDAMTGPECTGTSADSECDMIGKQIPTCSWDPLSATRCDDHGNVDLFDEDADCYICDALSANPGASCSDESDCQSQCYDTNGTPTGTCDQQSDCGPGETCRGRCDQSQTCLIIRHGSPLVLEAGLSSACLSNEFREDVFGTTDIDTGGLEHFQQRFSVSHQFEAQSRPCPTCGGFCAGLPLGHVLEGRVCQGTCSTSGDDCRFDGDCPPAETCTTASDTCGDGFCNLDLVCRGGPRDGLSCRVQGDQGVFGTTSNDCLPLPGLNISGQGSASDFFPSTTAAVTLPDAMPCSNPDFALYDCPCPDDGGAPTRPNFCAFACNAGAELETGCGTASSPTGFATLCVGGNFDGDACDEDADCAPGGGTCSDNPTHCVGDPALDLTTCSTNAECGVGTCEDACPSGRCVPLCVVSAGDSEEGECAAGPVQYHCSGPNDEWRLCPAANATESCTATCQVAATPCMADGDCPAGDVCQGPCLLAGRCEAGTDNVLGTSDDLPGAGICVADTLDCYVNELAAAGAPSPTNPRSVSVYCVEASASVPANVASGLGGPGRIRVDTLILTNGFASIP